MTCLESHSRARARILAPSSPASTTVFHQPMLWPAGTCGTHRWWDMRNKVHICPWDYTQVSKDPTSQLPFPPNPTWWCGPTGEGLTYLDEVVLQLKITMALIHLGSGRAESASSGLSRLGFELYFFCLPAI